jgi:hypothetical protein
MAIAGFSGDVTRPQDYRTFFANTFGLQFTGAELIIRYAITKDAANPLTGVDEQCAVAMSSISAKALMLTLKALIDQAESLGQPIPVSPDVTDIIKKMVEETKRK